MHFAVKLLHGFMGLRLGVTGLGVYCRGFCVCELGFWVPGSIFNVIASSFWVVGKEGMSALSGSMELSARLHINKDEDWPWGMQLYHRKYPQAHITLWLGKLCRDDQTPNRILWYSCLT